MFHPQRNWKVQPVQRIWSRLLGFHPQRNWKRIPRTRRCCRTSVSSSKELKEEERTTIMRLRCYCFILKGIERRSLEHYQDVDVSPVSSSKELKVFTLTLDFIIFFVLFHPQRNWKFDLKDRMIESSNPPVSSSKELKVFFPRAWRSTSLPTRSVSSSKELKVSSHVPAHFASCSFHPQRNWKLKPSECCK